MGVVSTHFRPEFLNRIDETVVFGSLAKDQIAGIADIQLDHLRKRLGERELNIELSEAAMTKIVDAGYDPVYGARPLKRAIQQLVENQLAERILRGDFLPGDVIYTTVENDQLVFSNKAVTLAH